MAPARRTGVDDALLRCLLPALEARGGELTEAAAARALGKTRLQLRGILAAAGRRLNVEGYPVLGQDLAADAIRLDRDLLRVQFRQEVTSSTLRTALRPGQ